jgi:hypothetical protein
MRVAVSLGTVPVGSIEVKVSDGPAERPADREFQAAAMAWDAITRNGVFTVDGKRFTAAECAEWWA